MSKKNQIVPKKKKNSFAWLFWSFIFGCLLCGIIPIVSDYVLKYNSKKSHAEKLKNGYYD